MKTRIALIASILFRAAFAATPAVTTSLMTNYVCQSVSSLSNYVETVLSTGGTVHAEAAYNAATNANAMAAKSIDVSYAAVAIATNNIDDIVENPDGSWTVRSIIDENGVPTIKSFIYDVTFSTNRADYYKGFVVEGSTVPGVTKGMYFCLVDGGAGYYCWSARTNAWTCGGYVGVSEGPTNMVFASTNGYEILDSTFSQGKAGIMQICAYSNEISTATLKGSFTVYPCYLTTAQMQACIGESSHIASTNDSTWGRTAVPRDESISINPVQRVTANAVRRLRAPLFAAAAQLPIGVVPPAVEPLCEQVDWAEYMGDCEDDEYYEPKTWWTEGQWNNANYWPHWGDVTVKLPRDNGGKIEEITKKYPAEAMQAKYPPPYAPYYVKPVKKRRQTCKNSGHIWTRDNSSQAACRKCDRCKEKENHSTSADPEGDKCALCDNEIHIFKKEADGNYTIKGTEECLRPTWSHFESKHAGWHHEGPVDPNSTTYEYCSCQCGKFGQDGSKLEHDFEGQEEQIQEWTDCGDGIYHKGQIQCQREGCGFITWVFRPHTLDTSAELTLVEPVVSTDYGHLMEGPCEKCTATDVRKEMPHEPDGSKNCTCMICDPEGVGPSYHNFGGEIDCGELHGSFCTVCEEPEDGSEWINNPDGHDFGIWTNDTYHVCMCGKYDQKHDREYFNGGSCSVCHTSKKKKGRKCSGKRTLIDGKEVPVTDEQHEEEDDSRRVLPGDPDEPDTPGCPDCGHRWPDDLPPSLEIIEDPTSPYHGLHVYEAPGRVTGIFRGPYGVPTAFVSIGSGDDSLKSVVGSLRTTWIGWEAIHAQELGSSFSFTIRYNPKVIVSHDSFTHKTVTNLTFISEVTYSGTIKDDSPPNYIPDPYIEWN